MQLISINEAIMDLSVRKVEVTEATSSPLAATSKVMTSSSIVKEEPKKKSLSFSVESLLKSTHSENTKIEGIAKNVSTFFNR